MVDTSSRMVGKYASSMASLPLSKTSTQGSACIKIKTLYIELWKRTFNYDLVVSFRLLCRQITTHRTSFDRHRAALNLPATFVLWFAALFLICRFRDIRNKAVGHFERKYELFMVVVLAAQQSCGQSDFIDCNLQLCRSLLPPYPPKYVLSHVVLRCRYVCENASPEITPRLVQEAYMQLKGSCIGCGP